MFINYINDKEQLFAVVTWCEVYNLNLITVLSLPAYHDLIRADFEDLTGLQAILSGLAWEEHLKIVPF